jgi:hypothetical protein
MSCRSEERSGLRPRQGWQPPQLHLAMRPRIALTGRFLEAPISRAPIVAKWTFRLDVDQCACGNCRKMEDLRGL